MNLICEKTLTCTNYYLYDENDEIYGFIQNEIYKYYYVKDSLNNILGIIDAYGNLVVKYSQDAYGNCLRKEGSIYNPIRYKGYYYDEETNMYYCKSRYYVPELYRWLNIDNANFLKEDDINKLNLFVYCSNNPVMYFDGSGHFAILATLLIAGTVMGAISGFGFTAGKELIEKDWNFSKVNWGKAFNNGIVGAATGFSLAMGGGILGPVLAGTAAAGAMSAGTAFGISLGVSFAAGSLGYATEEWMNGRTPSFKKTMANGAFVAAEGAMNFVMGGILGSVGTIGTKGKFLRSVEWYAKFVFAQELTTPFKYGIDIIRRNL